MILVADLRKNNHQFWKIPVNTKSQSEEKCELRECQDAVRDLHLVINRGKELCWHQLIVNMDKTAGKLKNKLFM